MANPIPDPLNPQSLCSCTGWAGWEIETDLAMVPCHPLAEPNTEESVVSRMLLAFGLI